MRTLKYEIYAQSDKKELIFYYIKYNRKRDW